MCSCVQNDNYSKRLQLLCSSVVDWTSKNVTQVMQKKAILLLRTGEGYFYSLIPTERTGYFKLSKQTQAMVVGPVSSSLLETIKEQNSLFPVDISWA